MGQKKLIRFAEIKTFPNVLEYPRDIRGKWNGYFQNGNPITLELACGKGEYSLGLGRMYPERNFIGVDIKGNRIWKGAKIALAEQLPNIAFLRTQIGLIPAYFEKGEVSEIWITFPDPQLRLSKVKKRLTHPVYLRLYQQFLAQDGILHLKTDSPALYLFTKTVINFFGLELLEDADDLYQLKTIPPELEIKTHYEALNLSGSNRIHYLKFRLNQVLDSTKDAELKTLIREHSPG